LFFFRKPPFLLCVRLFLADPRLRNSTGSGALGTRRLLAPERRRAVQKKAFPSKMMFVL